MNSVPDVNESGRLIVSAGDDVLAIIADDLRNKALIDGNMLSWVRSGYAVSYETDEATWIPSEFTAPKPAPTPKPAPKKRKPNTPQQHWKAGDTVYLSWSHLSNLGRQTLTTYRLTRGVVEEFRMGQGIHKTVGVRFNGDPELTWLASHELTSAAEAE